MEFLVGTGCWMQIIMKDAAHTSNPLSRTTRLCQITRTSLKLIAQRSGRETILTRAITVPALPGEDWALLQEGCDRVTPPEGYGGGTTP
jgi:hypothetical protein